MSEKDVSPADPGSECSPVAGAPVAAASAPSAGEPAAPGSVESAAAPAGADGEPDEGPRRGHLPRGAAVAVVLLVVALTLTVFAIVAPRANADQVFVDTARSQGHRVTIGDQQSLLVSAARKICARRAFHATVAERRATALSPKELHAVQQTFVGDARGFTVLALDTYCPD